MRNITDTKPTICLNARTYWSLSLSREEETYELRVQHWAPEDEFTFLSHAAATRDELELLTAEQYAERVEAIVEHEGCGECERCRNDYAGMMVLSGGDGGRGYRRDYLCATCAADTSDGLIVAMTEGHMRARAEAALEDRVRVMTEGEAAVLAHLRRTWDAFTLLFNPATNL